MRGGVVPELCHQGMPLEARLHESTLNAEASPVDQPHSPESERVGRRDELVDDVTDVARGEGVQVELWSDRHLVCHVSCADQGCS